MIATGASARLNLAEARRAVFPAAASLAPLRRGAQVFLGLNVLGKYTAAPLSLSR